MIKLLIIFLMSATTVMAAEARIPISVEITYPAYEMTYDDAVLFCKENPDDLGCDTIETMEVPDVDGYTVFEILTDNGELENQ